MTNTNILKFPNKPGIVFDEITGLHYRRQDPQFMVINANNIGHSIHSTKDNADKMANQLMLKGIQAYVEVLE